MPKYLQLGIYDKPGGTLVADWSRRCTALSFTTVDHGFGDLTATISLPKLTEAFIFYDRPGLPHVVVSYGAQTVWEGRLEDVAIIPGGIRIKALGYWRALVDLPYTALWSTTSTAAWRAATNDDVSTYTPEKWALDNQNRLYFALQKNTTYTNAADRGVWMLQTPYSGTRKVVAVQFDFSLNLPSNWVCILVGADEGFASAAAEHTLTGTGSVITGSVNKVLSASKDFVYFQVYNNTGGNVTNATETGATYCKLTNIRVVTSTTNRVNTTFTANRGSGSNVQATVGSTANMYVGQRLTISNGAGTTTESVIVISIADSTHFNATFANSYVTTDTITGFAIYADEIAQDIVGDISTTNATQLSSSTALIQSPTMDLTDEVYEDQLPADVLSHLAPYGDNQTPPRQYESGVYEGRVLYFRPKQTSNRTWYVDITSLELERTLDRLANSVYGVYQDATGRALRTSASSDAYSISRYGLTRQLALATQTTSSTQSGIQRDAALQDDKDPQPRAKIAFSTLFDSLGARWPLWMLRAGDSVTIRNLPPTLSTSLDRIRTFRVTHTEYDAIQDRIAIEPEAPMPGLATMLGFLARATVDAGGTFERGGVAGPRGDPTPGRKGGSDPRPGKTRPTPTPTPERGGVVGRRGSPTTPVNPAPIPPPTKAPTPPPPPGKKPRGG